MSGAHKKIIETIATYFDTKAQILEKIGDVSGFEIGNQEVLIAIYQRPEMTPGGIALTHKTRKEDIYQGKVGLVIKIGRECRFEYTDRETGIVYGIPNIALHDWVVTRPSDTWALDVSGNPETLDRDKFVECRLTLPRFIRGKVSNPAMVW